VDTIKPAALENYQQKRKRQGKADSTVDADLKAAGGMIRKAFNNDMVSGKTLKTFQRVDKLLEGNANARDRILQPNEYDSLIRHLSNHLRPQWWLADITLA
jgi:hypothetical protein